MSDWDWGVIRSSWPLLRDATWVSVQLFFISLVIATGVGLLIALMRLSPFGPFRWVAAVFVWIFRGLPALVILFFSFSWFGPKFGITSFQAAILGLAVSSAAYKGEIIRAGLMAVDRGQYEAADALGFTKAHSLRRIIIPQGIRVMIPNYMSNATLLFKATSLAAVVGLTELTGRSRQLANSTFKPLEILTAAGAVYLVLTTLLVLSQEFLERRFALES